MESKEKEVVKVCPICSNTEIAFERNPNPLSKEPRAVPKFVPMGCLGKVCMFYKEEVGQCIFIMQNAILSSMAVKILNVESKNEEKK